MGAPVARSWREPLTRSAAWLALFFVLWGCAWHWFGTRNLLMVGLMLPIAFVALLTPWLLRFGQGLAANALVGTSVVSMSAVTLLSGGTSIGVLVVSMILPVFAAMLCGIRMGVFWSLCLLASCVALIFLVREQVAFPVLYSMDTAFRGLVGAAPTIILMGLVAAIVYERARGTASSQLNQSLAELRELRSNLELSEQRYRRVSELTTDFAYQVTRKAEGPFVVDWMTHAVAEITGYQALDLLRLQAQDFIHQEDLAEVKALWEDVKKGHSVEAQFRILHPSGEHRWLRAGAASSLDSETGDLSIWGAARDITTEIEQANRSQHQQKLEVLGQLTGGVAHDFNNLLGVVKGSLELLKGKSPTPSEQQLLKEASQAADKGAALVSRLLTFSRQQPNKPVELDLNQRVRELLPLLRRAVGVPIELRFEPAPETAGIFVDPSQLENSLLNLCLNARDAISGPGTVTIQVRIVNPEQVSLEVVDDGPGMSPEVASRSIEPFFSTKESGSGLGLSTAYGFVKQAGGDLGIDTTPDGGTTISLIFPLLPDFEPSEASDTAMGTPKGSGRILLVDDQDALRRVGRASLEALGYEASAVASAEDAIDFLKTEPLPDAIVSDWILPGEMDGHSLACWVRDRYESMPVLLVTGFSPDNLKSKGGQFPVLMKPFSLKDLGQSLRNVMEPTAV